MPGEIAWCENPNHAHKESSCEARRAPLWLLRFHPLAIRVRVRDWLWLRRAKRSGVDPDSVLRKLNGGYTVELGGEMFTQGQWEAVQVYAEGTSAMTQIAEATPLDHVRAHAIYLGQDPESMATDAQAQIDQAQAWQRRSGPECPDGCVCHAYMPPGRVCSWCQQEGHEDQ